MKNFDFIDLFSGIGGFHQALTQLGGHCVLASEIDPHCNALYEKNYGISSDVNIRNLDEKKDIPDHQVLCGGFPCQSFSKAGKQAGLTDQTRGTLFFEIARILREKHPTYIVLENVRNLVSHDKGNTWNIIQNVLRDIGYRLEPNPRIISPHQFGVPQLRERVVILGKYDPTNINKPLKLNLNCSISKAENSIYTILTDKKVEQKYYISEYEEKVLQAWDEFYHGINLKVIGFPIWTQYFKCETYDEDLPTWKKEFINKNIKLYQDNKQFLDSWLAKYNNLEEFTPTHRKFEWQAGTSINSIWEGVIQFRPSGIRVKTPTCFPALVAMVQIPIIGKYKRRLTVEEAGRLQSFPNPTRDESKMSKNSFLCDTNDQQAYKQFGNSVNVEVMKACAKALFECDKKENS